MFSTHGSKRRIFQEERYNGITSSSRTLNSFSRGPREEAATAAEDDDISYLMRLLNEDTTDDVETSSTEDDEVVGLGLVSAERRNDKNNDDRPHGNKICIPSNNRLEGLRKPIVMEEDRRQSKAYGSNDNNSSNSNNNNIFSWQQSNGGELCFDASFTGEVRNTRPPSFHVTHPSDDNSMIFRPSNGEEEVKKWTNFGKVEAEPRKEEEEVEYVRRKETAMERKRSDQTSKHKDKKKKKRRDKGKDMIHDIHSELEKERASIMAQLKADLEAEQQANRWHNRFRRWMNDRINSFSKRIGNFLGSAETFVSNLPLTIGAVGLAWMVMGVVWFKFTEENLSSCIPVHFYSPRCTFPEFPGCFACDTSVPWYRVALNFHYACTIVAGTLLLGFLAKLSLAWQVVADELSNPATSTPCGVVCVMTICVFAGHGKLGEVVVLTASCIHLCLAFRFLYMAIGKYHMLPDPSWFPNTVAIGYAAIKTWLYFPFIGYILMSLCICFFFSFFFISVIRVALNRKISAPVCWIQMSAPSITLFCMTIMGQPPLTREQFIESSPEAMTLFRQMHHRVYMPCMHFMFVLALIGVCSAVHGLWARWDVIRKKEFSPAHAAFCFPTLSHTNSIQAYRAAVHAFSSIPRGSLFMTVLNSYWMCFLILGTVANIIMTAKYFYALPRWTKVDTTGEEEPPYMNDTLIHEMLQDTGEIMRQSFVSPAVLEANEAGSLIRVRRGTEDGRGHFVRTRHITSVGFDPALDWNEFNEEREALLEWVVNNAPRQRIRTMSNPVREFFYGTFDDDELGPSTDLSGRANHKRWKTGI